MRVSIVRADGIVTINGAAREVDLSDLRPCHAIHWDDERGTGKVEFTFDDLIDTQVRDLEAELAACEAARAEGLPEPEAMIYKAARVRRPDEVLASFDAYQVYLERWLAAAPPAAPVLTQEERAALAIDTKDRVLFEIEFDQENRLRAIERAAGLDKPAITRAQYRDALITLWKQLNS